MEGVKTILFDIDLTLVDTDRLRIKMVESLAKYTSKNTRVVEIEIENYAKCLESTKDFHPKELAKYLAKKWGLDQNKLTGQLWNKAVVGGMEYSETRAVLEKLAKKYEIGIYSEGYDDFQRYKLEVNDLTKFFDSNFIFITRRKIGNPTVKEWNNVVVVDDNEKVCQALREYANIKVVWLNRKNDNKMDRVSTIKKLNELESEIT